MPVDGSGATIVWTTTGKTAGIESNRRIEHSSFDRVNAEAAVSAPSRLRARALV